MIKKYPGIIEIFIGFFMTFISTILIILGALSESTTLILVSCIGYILSCILVTIGVVRLVLNSKKNV